jgi:hypothetical protein
MSNQSTNGASRIEAPELEDATIASAPDEQAAAATLPANDGDGDPPPAHAPSVAKPKRRRLPHLLPERLRSSRLYRSRVVRLLVALAVLALLFGVLAFGLLRVIGSRDRIGNFALPFVEDFTTVDVNTWITREGVWSLRQDMLAQIANLEKPAQLYAPYRMPADQPYHLSTYVVFNRSTRTAGVNFNAQYPDLTKKQHQVFIARTEATAADEGELPPPAMELVAGYTDDSGQFVRQVSAPFELDTVQYRLDIYVLGNSYTVQLNGQTMIERRPLFYPNGMVGFVAEGTARFDTLRITSAETREPGNQVYVSDFESTPGGAGWVPLSGTWELSEGELVQVNPAAQDAVIGYEGSAFENYVVQTSLRHLEGVGGGLLFNMASPYQLNSSYVARFSEQTDSVFWGFFDEKGLFTRQGYFDIAPASKDPHGLTVYVGFDSYDVYLDEQLLVRNVPFQGVTPATSEGRSGGHIGLITSRSSVAFARVEVFPLFDNSQMKLPQPQPIVADSAAAPAQISATATPPAATPATPPAAPATQAAASTEQSATPAPTNRPPAATPLPPASVQIQQGDLGWDAEFSGSLGESGWQPISGQWIVANGTLVQNDPNGIDLAISYTDRAFQGFVYEVSFSHNEGQSAGILFNMPFTDRLNGAHMVRYSERRPGGIFWGYFDDEARFVGQGYANVDPPATTRHTLRVVSDIERYSIFLDGVLLASDLPLRQNYGYLGLVTVQSKATFDSIAIDGLETAPAITPVQPLSAAGIYTDSTTATDRRVLSGQWEIEQGVYRQLAPDAGDYVLNSGVYASNYRIEADIALPTKPDAGAGFTIHMPERGQRNGATVVRFINGGDGLFWGVFDASGIFLGRGSVTLPEKAEGDNLHRLLVDVRGNVMDILVDDESVAEEIVLPRSEGWVGLVAYGGPVTFTNLQITVGGIQ